MSAQSRLSRPADSQVTAPHHRLRPIVSGQSGPDLRDWHASSGPKHWHSFDVLTRKPVIEHPSAPASG